jgi:hypothetical protein
MIATTRKQRLRDMVVSEKSGLSEEVVETVTDFLECTLRWPLEARSTAGDLLAHAWLQE